MGMKKLLIAVLGLVLKVPEQSQTALGAVGIGVVGSPFQILPRHGILSFEG